ncbi:MAG: EscU/YscU/HrcU family type III secretion system export apparatus switch protein, partial [Clostridiales bacterium]|nr:EscU/YscU/HrcU family type III secretion system export apparatus switch protein [Clostridiales bacterium]
MEYQYAIPLNLHFFDSGEKTEKPTAKKKSKARSEGQVAKSQEVSTSMLFIFGFFGLRMFAGDMLDGLLGLFRYGFEMIPDMEAVFEKTYMSSVVNYLFGQVLLLVLPLLLLMLVVGLIVNIIQVGWRPTTKPLKPKFSKLNPLKGVKKLISTQSIVNLAKSLMKFAIVGLSIYMMIRDEINTIPVMMSMELTAAMSYIGNLIVDLGVNIGMIYVAIAVLDYVYVRYTHFKSLKMTKQEVKEEHKQAEGNPQVKGKIRQKMREISMRRMMQNVPQADVIITNPTHYAVALQYDHLKAGAPLLVAKGVDFLARRIKEKG